MDELAEQFFRHEHGRLVARLSRRVGVHHLEEVEDAVQSALEKAVETWTRSGRPDNPSAWLTRVAHNELLGALRQSAGRQRILARHPDPLHAEEPEVLLAGEVRDDLLRMLLVCCDEAIPLPSQLALALKTLCGFGVQQIALLLFTSEANVYKRLGRARARLRQHVAPEPPDLQTCAARVPAVHKVLYLLFTEGYLSSHTELAIRRELCDEALRLAGILAQHPLGRTPQTAALLALMHLHVARMAGRQDDAGGLLLLEEQDRSRWDRRHIEVGLEWLARSAEGAVFSRYHAEAGIAAEHCLASSLDETRWDRVAASYALLERVAPSPLHTLNRAVAVAEAQGPAAGLQLLEGLEPPTWLEGSHMWSAVLADLHRRSGHDTRAERYRDVAIQTAPSPAVAELLRRRLGR